MGPDLTGPELVAAVSNAGGFGILQVAPKLVLAAGGIADARGLAAALCLGADGFVMGARFLATHEANAHPVYKAKLLAAAEILRETINGAERLIRELSAKVHENGRT